MQQHVAALTPLHALNQCFKGANSINLNQAIIDPEGEAITVAPPLAKPSKLSPSVAQRGIDGTSAQNPPASASWITTFSFIP
jgi:hypothetical protein